MWWRSTERDKSEDRNPESRGLVIVCTSVCLCVCVWVLPIYNSAAAAWPWLFGVSVITDSEETLEENIKTQQIHANTHLCTHTHTHLLYSTRTHTAPHTGMQVLCVYIQTPSQTHSGLNALCICKLLIRGSDWEWSSLLGHTTQPRYSWIRECAQAAIGTNIQ